MILTQRTILNGALPLFMDAAQSMSPVLKAARDAVAKLQQEWPGNPDVEIAAALQNVSLEPGRPRRGRPGVANRFARRVGLDEKPCQATAIRQPPASIKLSLRCCAVSTNQGKPVATTKSSSKACVMRTRSWG